MNPLIDATYWLSLATWFGAAMFSVIAPPIILRVVQKHDPTLPRVLSVNLDHQHSSLLSGEIVSELLQTLFRVQIVSALCFAPALVAKWFMVDLVDLAKLAPIAVSALYVGSLFFLIYGWRVTWPATIKERQTYIDNADNPDVANAALDRYEQHSHDCVNVLRNLLFLVLGMILFSTALRPIVHLISGGGS